MELDNISIHLEKLSKNDWAKLFVLIPIIESTENFIESDEYIEAKVVSDFSDIMYDLGLVIPFDWMKWNKGVEIVDKGNYNNLDTITLIKILTAFIRSDRFGSGVLVARFKDGTIEKILKELKKNIERE